ncbi:MAG: hypothetical protein NT176_01460, partial [Proteobacteria bacterium]|nr:hypothetical protein [Pseudomonadota bacterium]
MTKPIPISGPAPVSAAGFRTLRSVVALMIPASAEYQVPGADDEAIFADIASSLGRDSNAIRQAVQLLDEMSGGVLSETPADARGSVVRKFVEAHPSLAVVLVAVTVRCYYRDTRVMRSLGMEPRPPFP